jgi:hypothetical protein
MRNSPNPYHPDAAPWNESDGIPWSEETTRDLIAALEQRQTVDQIVDYLQYSEGTVRAKMQELGLKEKRPVQQTS